jgi:hypothetical protein
MRQLARMCSRANTYDGGRLGYDGKQGDDEDNYMELLEEELTWLQHSCLLQERPLFVASRPTTSSSIPVWFISVMVLQSGFQVGTARVSCIQ